MPLNFFYDFSQISWAFIKLNYVNSGYDKFSYNKMFSNKTTQNTRPSRIDSSSQRSNTPQHAQALKPQRISQSVTKPQITVPMGLSTLPPINQQFQFEKPYYLGKGNNHQLIKKILARRKGWREVGSSSDFVYFRWVQNSFSFKFHLLGKQCLCFNHFEYQRQLSHKQRLVKNLVNFCESNKLNAYNFLPVSFILDLNTGQQDLALHAFVKFFNRNYPDESSNRRYQSIILPRSKYVPYLTAQQLNKRSQGNFYCKPYFPKTFIDEQTKSYLWILKPTFLNRGRGVVLFKDLEELQKLIWKYYEGEGLEDYCQKYTHQEEKPKNMENSTQPSNKFDDMIKSEEQKQKEQYQTVSMLGEQSNKSDVNMNTQPSQDKRQMKNKKFDVTQKKQYYTEKLIGQEDMGNSANYNTTKKDLQLPRCLSFIIQKYIQRPMLIESKKFDIRVWVLLTQTLQFYIFQEAYLRFSSQPYSTKDSHLNPFVHLTNNSVQKYCNEYDNESGNQWPLSAIQKYIQPEHKANNIYKSIVNKIKEIISLSIFSVRRKINVNSRKDCFELFGYDFMIDQDYKVWLIEVNTNPAIQQASPLLKMLLPRMVDDMFKLTIDRIFSCKMKEDLEDLPVTGYDNDHNMWEYLGDLREGGNIKNDKRLTFARR